MHLDRRTLLGLIGLAAVGVPTAGCLGGAAGNPGTVTAPNSRPSVDADAVAAWTAGNADFGVDLFRRVGGTDANAMISPVSAATALAMAWAGASRDTADQMAEAMRFPDDVAVHDAVGALAYDLDERATAEDGFELTLANALWLQAGFAVHEAYVATLEDRYGAEPTELDFVGEAEASRETINDWAADATNDRIDELFPVGSLTPDTRLVLTNAVYLLADWAEAFDPDDTDPSGFTNLDGSETTVQMMRTTTELRMLGGVDLDYDVLELPYVGGEVSMVLILPPEGEFEAFVRALDGAWLMERFAELEAAVEREVWVSLPRFSFETETALSDLLVDLGMVDAFDPAHAAFDGIADTALYLEEVYHDTFVAVDEEGTEAAAATGAEMRPVSAPPGIAFDRPFLFAIRDRPTDAVMFLGQVVDADAFE